MKLTNFSDLTLPPLGAGEKEIGAQPLLSHFDGKREVGRFFAVLSALRAAGHPVRVDFIESCSSDPSGPSGPLLDIRYRTGIYATRCGHKYFDPIGGWGVPDRFKPKCLWEGPLGAGCPNHDPGESFVVRLFPDPDPMGPT